MSSRDAKAVVEILEAHVSEIVDQIGNGHYDLGFQVCDAKTSIVVLIEAGSGFVGQLPETVTVPGPAGVPLVIPVEVVIQYAPFATGLSITP